MKEKPFDPTKPVQYRNGEPARIICTDGRYALRDKLYPIITESVGGECRTHTVNGVFNVGGDSPYDLINIPAKHKLTGWVNVYSDSKHVHETKIVADRHADDERIACLDLSKYNIEFEEGEGL